MFKDDRLPAPYAMSLRAIVRLHAIRDARSSNCSYPTISLAAAPSASTAHTTAESERDEPFDYHFWSDSALHDLKRDRLANADPLYHVLAMARSTIELTDMARYLVMYELGGVYSDLDMEFVRPVDELLQRGYPCIISAENPIQVAFLWDSSGFGVTNSVLLCRPRHPFFELALRMLSEPSFRAHHFVVKSTGPRFLTAVLQRYRALNPSRTQLCDRDPTASPDCVYVAPSHVFESLELLNLDKFFSRCENEWLKNNSIPLLLRNECSALLRRSTARGSLSGEDNSEERLAFHHYLHLGYSTNLKGNCEYGLNTLLKGYWTYMHDIGIAYIQLYGIK